jgi:hypothetical protein
MSLLILKDITVNLNKRFDRLKPFSVEFWIFCYRSSAGQVISRYHSGKSGEFFVAIEKDRTPQFFREAPDWKRLSNSSFPKEKWTHYAATYDGDMMRVCIF